VDQTPRKGLLNTSYYALAIAAWIVLVVLAVTHHELWRDEFQAILLGFESGSIRELIFNTRYEGHGAAWYLAVFGIGKLGGSVIAVQLFHFCISLSIDHLSISFFYHGETADHFRVLFSL
jgi:hypothetical protein